MVILMTFVCVLKMVRLLSRNFITISMVITRKVWHTLTGVHPSWKDLTSSVLRHVDKWWPKYCQPAPSPEHYQLLHNYFNCYPVHVWCYWLYDSNVAHANDMPCQKSAPKTDTRFPVPVSGASDIRCGTKFFWYWFSVSNRIMFYFCAGLWY